jgi:hypothetical protein
MDKYFEREVEDIDLFKTLIGEIDFNQEKCDNLLGTACIKGFIKTFEFLLELGGNINCREDTFHRSLLSLILLFPTLKEENRKNMCQALIENNIDVNSADRDGVSCLMYAVQEGYEEICEILIAKGADVNRRDLGNTTPLIYALGCKVDEFCVKKEIIELLIANGADINARGGFEGNTPFIFAIREKQLNICKLLIKNGADINIQNRYGESAFIIAAKAGDIEVCDFLIKYGAKLHTLDSKKYSGFIHAVKRNNVAICHYLIKKGIQYTFCREEIEMLLTKEWKDFYQKILLFNKKKAFDRRKHFLNIRKPCGY